MVLGAECWVLGAECWVLGAECWVLGAECWVLGAGRWKAVVNGIRLRARFGDSFSGIIFSVAIKQGLLADVQESTNAVKGCEKCPLQSPNLGIDLFKCFQKRHCKRTSRRTKGMKQTPFSSLCALV
ncbi:hypothetical protein BC938DRAFT_482689 [Jimgerdemannia flammicorona]|uniref:Uncharacterized protein n=1 Tax=Jimgerdemannia flammicorona TaxID=994334 RepID=A0A433QDG2_9FUNG|nr:hypothetical protein BC938DRAFT_482689 [Jimgerdemannia flammicorona]